MGRVGAAVICVAALLLAGSANAQPTVAQRLLNPSDPETLAAHYPPLAGAHGLSGQAIVECTVRVDSETDCTLVDEEPAGSGFGQAALRVVERWRMTPLQENGHAIEDVVRFPVRFAPLESDFGPPPIYPDITVNGVTPEDRRVTPEEIASTTVFYPARARSEGVNGRALVACIARLDGMLDCATEREAPEGYGFGEHAARVVIGAVPLESPARQPGYVTRVAVDFALARQGQTPVRPERWEREPQQQDVQRFYPRAARSAGIEATVMLGCIINADRTLACEALHSSVPDRGFENAARLAAGGFLLSPEVLGTPGRSAGDRIVLEVHFRQD